MEGVAVRLAGMRDLAEAGVPPDADEYDVLRRAFRLRHFHRCPRCDQRCSYYDGPGTFSWIVQCACGWSYSATYRMLVECADPSLIAEQIVREVP